MRNDIYKSKSEITLYPGMGAWHFGHLDKKISARIKERNTGTRRGFGSIKIIITIGKTIWKTSIFPSKATKTYIFPIKKSVRTAESIFSGDIISYKIEII